jgi:S-DNA-T family DNA segregation ATPase FtsK/SpoIIIE
MKRSTRLFPQSFLHLFDAWVLGACGIGLLAVVVFLLVSLLAYNPMDQSINTATNASATNILGQYGAYTADCMYQFIGNIAYLFIIALFVFSWNILVLKKNILTFFRGIQLLLSIVLFCISIQSLFVEQVSSESYLTLKTSCGAIGFVFAKNIYALMQSHGGLRWFFLVMSGIFVIAVSLWKSSTGITFKKVYRSIIKCVAEIRRLFRKTKAANPTNAQKSSNFQSAESFLEDDDESADFIGDFMNKRGDSREKRGGQGGSAYSRPSPDLLTPVKEDATDSVTKDALNLSSKALLSVLNEFGVNGEILEVQPGPVVTMYEFRPAPGIKTSRVISLADDISRSMSALSARIATIPGKNAIGIELPNDKRHTVFLRPLLQTGAYKQTTAELPLILGKDIAGKPIIADLSKMPHLLVAGTTGSGKSVSINTMILSLLYKFTPEQCKFIMVDPKMLELSVYNDIPHLLTPVVTDPSKAIFALKWAVREMENRYKSMSRLGVRNIENFNQKLQVGRRKGDVFSHRVQTGFDQETGNPIFEDQQLDYQEYPYIVVVVDEMADLMLVAGKEIELAVQRLAQMARAAGIHLIMATQRPSVDVITGTIKANFPTRISFQVTSKIDSRTILGEQGAEQLLGHGDMLFMSGGGRIQRVHGPFVSDNEVEVVAQFLRAQEEPDYVDGITDDTEGEAFPGSDDGKKDDLYKQAIDFVRREGRVSISFIQRQFQIGYNKAARFVEQMEKDGVVSPPDRSGKRELL